MLSFQQIILNLQNYWSKQGCALLQPIDIEVGAGTLHSATILNALGKKPWKCAYVQPCRRPNDLRYGNNPNRVGHYYQFQVLIKPAPENIQELYLKSLEEIGIDVANNDIRFVEDDWENPTVGAAGLGWEVWYNGMEISQFTYMQQVGSIECEVIPVELTYGLERIAMHIQGVENIFDINMNGAKGSEKITYGDVFLQSEKEQSEYVLQNADTKQLFLDFDNYEKKSQNLAEKKLVAPAYEYALKSSHVLNLLDASGAISVNQRADYIARVRNLVRGVCLIVA